uniref:TraM recognition domain-containing protein n=1 Tax=Capnocytophaga sputigena TaxID=1019 RepID=UPI0028E347E3
DALEAAQALMFGLYPKWSQKSGDFFVESAINFVASGIWALKIIEDGKYCTVPHLIQFMSLEYDKMFPILKYVNDEFINNVIAPFLSAYEQEATDQLEGQLGTVRIAISRLTSPSVYYVMTDDFEQIEKKDENGNPILNPITQEQDYDYISKTGISVSLQINDPKNPQIFCLSNNPKKQRVYSPLLSLYNTRLMSLINKKRMNRCGVILDELPTLAFPPSTVDNLIATGRSNKIAVFLGFQDFTQLIRDFGKDIAEAIIGTVGNIFSGQVNFDTAKKLSESFGKIKIKKESISESKDSTSVSINTEMVDLIPASVISTLSQGTFVGKLADEKDQKLKQKFFYSNILIDHKERQTYEQGEIPAFVKFDEPISEVVKKNFERIKTEIVELADAYAALVEPEEEQESE